MAGQISLQRHGFHNEMVSGFLTLYGATTKGKVT